VRFTPMKIQNTKKKTAADATKNATNTLYSTSKTFATLALICPTCRWKKHSQAAARAHTPYV